MTATRPAPVADRYPTRVAERPRELARTDPVVWGRAADGPLDEASLGRFATDGYLQVDELATPQEVRRYLDELARLSSDRGLRRDERTVVEPDADEVRSIFEVHVISPVFAELVRDPRVAGVARQLLGSDVYVHQSRVNFKPGFAGKEFQWHSDFETWHAEDGMPAMRAASISIALTDNHASNGPLMIMPGSHRTFISCVGETPDDNYRQSLRAQEVGSPDPASLSRLADRHGIDVLTGPAGGATVFDCNCMHGSNGNITPFPRANVFVVFNSVDNACVEPFAAPARRPTFVAARDFSPVPRASPVAAGAFSADARASAR
ncbi:MAG TPA: ectoine hydroxylase [Acidimicrobiales bacterium]|jgi:ectoine hydroxylase|nr:ectoine hydroxylase [Acidimicrobiales bacterium]